MVAEIRNPTGDTGEGGGGMFQETQRGITTVTAQDLVAYSVVTLVEETVITAEDEVPEEAIVTTPTPLPPPIRAKTSGWWSELLGSN